MSVLRRFYERYGEKLGPRALLSFDELERALKNKGFLTKWLDGVFAIPRADRLVARLLTAPAALREAAEGILSPAEQKLLLRDRPRRAADLQWSDHDLPLLDVARTLIDGPPRAYGHVIVDEAQDLSPMQLLCISRRAADGSLTMLGDVAQATGPVVYGAWEELQPFLPEHVRVSIEELKHAYRVPAEIMDLALPLLDRIAPDMERPLAYRRGGRTPRLVQASEGDVFGTAIREAIALADEDGLLAVIAPRSLAGGRSPSQLFDEMTIPVLTPRQSKGLEFDHVVVADPDLIVDEGGESGLRELYVALTRPTKTLVVVSREDGASILGQ
jgi:DNA helicase IV